MDLLCVLMVVSVIGASGSETDVKLSQWDKIFVDQCIQIFGGKDDEKVIDVSQRLEEKKSSGNGVFYEGEMRAQTATLTCYIAHNRFHSPITVVESNKYYIGECVELEMKLQNFKTDQTSDARNANFTIMPVSGSLIFKCSHISRSSGNDIRTELIGRYIVMNQLQIQENDERLLSFVDAIMRIALDEADKETKNQIEAKNYQDWLETVKKIENEVYAE